MSRWTPEFGVLRPRHGPALARHLLALDADDRCARFGLAMSDAALRAWVAGIRWDGQHWIGAWEGPCLRATLQLAPTGLTSDWELALTVERPLRRQGLATALLAQALGDPALTDCRGLLCHHGHAALRGMARRLGLALRAQTEPPRLRLDIARPG